MLTAAVAAMIALTVDGRADRERTVTTVIDASTCAGASGLLVSRFGLAFVRLTALRWGSTAASIDDDRCSVTGFTDPGVAR
jgi:hypothetical protein